MGEKWLKPYMNSLLDLINGGEDETVGFVSFASARSIGNEYVELSWYPNIYSRFHEVTIFLPRHAFITCLECWQIDEKPRIFIVDDWLDEVFIRSYSVFALVDVIGTKKAMKNGTLSIEKTLLLREHIDTLSAQNPNFAFISFADGLLIKSNWTVGHVDSKIKYTYDPESILYLIPKIQNIYKEVLCMSAYATIAQGVNEYYGNELLHISGKHICLNSLGLPFSQVHCIEEMARKNIKKGLHSTQDLYMDENFFHSLRISFEFSETKHKLRKYRYRSPIADVESYYYAEDCRNILQNLVGLECPNDS